MAEEAGKSNGKYPERKLDWENLFWSCGHCNGIKQNSLLRRESAFAAFKGCYVREHAVEYPQLQQYVEFDG